MEELILTRPASEYAGQIAEYRQEFLDAGDSMGGTGPLRRTEDTEEYIKVCIDYEDPKNVPPHLVPATQFLCIRKADNKLVGMIQVRHCFDDYLEKYGGHIGYSVRPCERRKATPRKCSEWLYSFAVRSGLIKCLSLVPTEISEAKRLSLQTAAFMNAQYTNLMRT